MEAIFKAHSDVPILIEQLVELTEIVCLQEMEKTHEWSGELDEASKNIYCEMLKKILR